MLRGFLRPLLCSLALIGPVPAQEVVVPRETKQEAIKHAPPPSNEPEQTSSESATPPPVKRKPHEKKSVAPTLEQMRASGALAAEGRTDRTLSQPARTGEPRSETSESPRPAGSATASPLKREAHVPQKSASRPYTPRGTQLDSIGPVRPTMIESGREQPSVTPSTKAALPYGQAPTP